MRIVDVRFSGTFFGADPFAPAYPLAPFSRGFKVSFTPPSSASENGSLLLSDAISSSSTGGGFLGAEILAFLCWPPPLALSLSPEYAFLLPLWATVDDFGAISGGFFVGSEVRKRPCDGAGSLSLDWGELPNHHSQFIFF